MVMDKLQWNFTSLDQLHYAVNSSLKYAMQNERCKRWDKVIETYKLMLWIIAKENMPEDYEPPSVCVMLLYETYYHIGVAYQHLGNHKKAVREFTNAIDTMSLPKNGCLAGCVTNTCLMTPVYARRAFAYTRVGDMKNAIKDAEKTVVLDSKNPDVYCIRALVKSTRGDDADALKDLDIAIKLNSSHMCALVLRAAINKPLLDNNGEVSKQETESYMNVTSFKHPCIMEFYDKFLFTLSVPHTIIQIDLTPEKPSKKQIESNPELYRTGSKRRPESAPEITPFKCGTPLHQTQASNMSTRRRLDYGEALRKHNCRPKTASAFFEQLGRERKKKAEIEEMELRKKIVAGVKKLAEVSNSRAVSDNVRTSVTPQATKYTPERYSPRYPRSEVNTRSILKTSNKENVMDSRDMETSPMGSSQDGKRTRKTTSAMSVRTVTSGYGSARTSRSYTSNISEKTQSSDVQKRVRYEDESAQKDNKEKNETMSKTAEPQLIRAKQTQTFHRQTPSSTTLVENTLHIQRAKKGSSTTMSILPSAQQKLVIPTPTAYSIPVFQPTNIKDAPRMYYKPWSGDRLPCSEVSRHIHTPAWY